MGTQQGLTDGLGACIAALCLLSDMEISDQEIHHFGNLIFCDFLSYFQELDPTENTESLSKEELGRVIGSRWLGKKSERANEEVDAGTKSNYDSSDEGPTDSHEEEYHGYDSEDDEHKYEDDETEDPVEDLGGEDHDSSSSYKAESDDDSDFSGVQDKNDMLLTAGI